MPPEINQTLPLGISRTSPSQQVIKASSRNHCGSFTEDI